MPHRSKGKFVMTGDGKGRDIGMTANGVSLPMRVPAFGDIQLAFSSTGSFAGTVKIQGAQGTANGSNNPDNPYDTAPDFSTSPDTDNHWTYCASYDMALVPEATNVVPGATGYVMTGTDSANLKSIYVLCGGFEWISLEVSNYSAGTFFATGYGFTTE